MGFLTCGNQHCLFVLTLVLMACVGIGALHLAAQSVLLLARFAQLDAILDRDQLPIQALGGLLLYIGLVNVIVVLFGCLAVLKRVFYVVLAMAVMLGMFAAEQCALTGLFLARVQFGNVDDNGVYRESFYDQHLGDQMDATFLLEYTREDLASTPPDNSTEVKPAPAGLFDSVQESLHCCGSNGSLDYTQLLLSLPTTCCSALDSAGQCQPDNAFERGCKQTSVTLFRDFLRTLATVTALFAGITVVATISTSVLAALYRRTPEPA